MGSFLGRTSEMAAVQAGCRRVVDEQRAIAVVVEGDPGCGKTRLLAEALPQTPIPFRVVVAGHEPERSLPLAVGLDLVRSLFALLFGARKNVLTRSSQPPTSAPSRNGPGSSKRSIGPCPSAVH